MNGPSTDENESIIDVFVLSRSDSDVPVRPEHLETKGYRVTLFSDSNQLLETLRYGKPNLLVCDSLSLGQEAYDVCRQIKADLDLWMIPVLIVTRASNLSDLLFVLDCNADNFIAFPFDTPYLVSLIDGMLVTPVEQPTPEQIKTQFKIQHDEHLFVVTADRRKLLEFLLSSFEIAVNKYGELGRAVSDIESLSSRLKTLEGELSEQERVNGVLNATLQEREQVISRVEGEIREASQKIDSLTGEKESLIKERDDGLTRIASFEVANHGLMQEIEDEKAARAREAEDLGGQVAALTSELSGVRADLASTKQALDDEISRRSDAESILAELAPEKENLEKAHRALVLDFEQEKTRCTAEQNRASAAEQEIRSLMEAKNQSEQDLTRIINELKNTAGQQAAELANLRDGRAEDLSRIATLESSLAALGAEKEHVEATLKKTAEDFKNEIEESRKNAEAAAETLAGKSNEAAALEAALRDERTAKEDVLAQVKVLETELVTARSILDQEKQDHSSAIVSLESALREREDAISALRGAHDEVRTDLDSHREDLSLHKQELARLIEDRDSLKARLEESAGQMRNLEEKLHTAASEQAESDKQVRSLADELEQLKEALAEERRANRSREEELHKATAAGDKTAVMLEEFKSEKERLESLLSDEKRNAADAKEALVQAQDEQERLKSLLASEREEHISEKERLDSLLSSEHRGGVDSKEALAKALDEQERLKSLLASEREEHISEKERLDSLLSSEREELHRISGQLQNGEAESQKRIDELKSESAAAAARVLELEAQVSVLEQEKADAEERAESLAAEIDQARTALADEWEDHMTDNERLAAMEVNRSGILDDSSDAEYQCDGTTACCTVVTRTSDLPSVIPAQTSAQAIPAPVQGDSGPVTQIEDLFEDEKLSDEKEDVPEVTIVRETDPFASVEEADAPSAGPSDMEIFGKSGTDESGYELQGDHSGLNAEETEADPDSTGAETEILPTYSTAPTQPIMAVPAGSFNRSQWFDLLKWAHHSGALSQDQRLQIVRMGRLIQKGRKLTNKQDEQVREILSLVQSLGYRFV